MIEAPPECGGATGQGAAKRALHRGRALVDPALREAVDNLPGSLRRIAGYHLGWWDAQGLHENGTAAGKALRPALALLAAEAVGGTAADALPAATAVELVHNFSLLHDDVMDGDAMRRHRPTAWSVFGVGSAILCGDALLALAFDVLAASGRPQSTEAARMLAAAVADLIAGQGEDLAFELRDDVDLNECLAMARKKTAALLEASMGLGALFGNGSASRIELLREFGADVGLAFQLSDDLLGIWGDPALTGKPVYSDLRRRKKSLPVVAALGSGAAGGARLAEAYRHRRPLSDEELAALAGAVERAGGRAFCAQLAGELLGRA
uniref:polyprenyl synthetase family protein n=1 Tax=Allorhizocola rhizosphaerae TaxID=1872709 RepID=UPI0013C2CBF8